MKNKILITLYIPSIDSNYEIFIPTNETIKKVVNLVVKSVNDMVDDGLSLSEEHYFIDPNTFQAYDNASIIRDTNIENSKKIILI